MFTPPLKCLLLVEDDALIRVAVAMLLEDEGFGVVAAPDAESALRLMRDGLDAPVMVTDVDLGAGASGVELADELRRLRPGIGIIFVTGRAASLAGRSLGPREAALSKPFQGHALSKLVRQMAAS